MKIGVDMDGVLAEIMPGLVVFHNRAYDTKLTLEDHSTYNLNTVWGTTSEQTLMRIYQYYQSKEFFNSPPVKGAKEGVKLLRQKKHDLVLITSRPYSVEYHSKKWLDIYFSGVFSHIVHTNQVSHKYEKKVKKSQICQQHNIDIVVEDCLEFAEDCATVCKKAILLDQFWNRENHNKKNIIRVFNWKEIVANI